MEFTIANFVQSMREKMYSAFPFELEEINKKKHANRPGHIRDVAFMNNQVITLDENTLMFEIGNTYAEERYPYYHILETAPYIRKRGRATDKTKGSQARIEYRGKRDYEKVSFNGKTYSKEYARNVRGQRNRRGQVSHWATDYMGRDYFINREADAYENIHYQYIEKMLNNFVLDSLAVEFGLKRARTQSTGLEEEYQAQSFDEHSSLADMVSAMIDSFDEGE